MEIKTATPEMVIVKLYEGALRFLRQAKRSQTDGDVAGACLPDDVCNEGLSCTDGRCFADDCGDLVARDDEDVATWVGCYAGGTLELRDGVSDLCPRGCHSVCCTCRLLTPVAAPQGLAKVRLHLHLGALHQISICRRFKLR